MRRLLIGLTLLTATFAFADSNARFKCVVPYYAENQFRTVLAEGNSKQEASEALYDACRAETGQVFRGVPNYVHCLQVLENNDQICIDVEKIRRKEGKLSYCKMHVDIPAISDDQIYVQAYNRGNPRQTKYDLYNSCSNLQGGTTYQYISLASWCKYLFIIRNFSCI